MEYLQALAPDLDPQAENMDATVGYIKDNRVRSFLEKAGYKIVAFDTGYFWDSWTNADYYFSPTTSSSLTSMITPFEGLFLTQPPFSRWLNHKYESSKQTPRKYKTLCNTAILNGALLNWEKLDKLQG